MYSKQTPYQNIAVKVGKQETQFIVKENLMFYLEHFFKVYLLFVFKILILN